MGADSPARSCRSNRAVGLRDSLGAGRDRRIAILLHFDFTISGAIDQSEYVFRDEEHVEALRAGRREQISFEGAFLVSGRLRGREYIRSAQVQLGGLDIGGRRGFPGQQTQLDYMSLF